MSAPELPRYAPPIEETTAPIEAGDVRADWCPACKAYTRLAGMTLLLTSGGVCQVGAWQWCEVCDDPTNPLPVRRIDGAR